MKNEESFVHLGYVYYEADCFDANRNPYVPLDAPNPSMAEESQKFLSGEGVQERKALCEKVENIWCQKIFKNLPLTEEEQEMMDKHVDSLAENIIKERRRIGGDWVVASCIPHKRSRDRIRYISYQIFLIYLWSKIQVWF